MSSSKTRRIPLEKMSLRFRQDPTQSLRLVTKYERRLLALFQEFKKEAMALVKSGGVPFLHTTLDLDLVNVGMKDLAKDVIMNPGQGIVKDMVNEATAQGVTYADMTAEKVGMAVGMGIGEAPADVIENLVTRDLSALEGVTDTMRKEITRTISDGLTQNMTLDQIAKQVGEQVKEIGYERARLIAQYETSYAINTAAVDRWTRLGIQHVEWLCAMDEHSCPICEGYANDHAGIYRIDEAPICPAHPRCRCALASVMHYETEEEKRGA